MEETLKKDAELELKEQEINQKNQEIMDKLDDLMDEMKNIDEELGFPGKSTFEEELEDTESRPMCSKDSSDEADLGLSGFNYISTEKIAEDLTCMNSQELIGDPFQGQFDGPQDDDEDLQAEIQRINNREKIELRQQIESLKRKLNDRDLELHQTKLEVKEKDIEISKLKNKCEKFETNINSVESKGKRITEKTRNFISEIKNLNSKVEKYQNKSRELNSKVMQLTSEMVKTKKDLDYSRKERSKKDHEISLKEKRISNLLEDMNKIKQFNKQNKRSTNLGKENNQNRLNQLEGQNKKLERQRNELFTVFKKQLRLIEILKKQKMHLEAAQLFKFTEDEFMSALDSNLKSK